MTLVRGNVCVPVITVLHAGVGGGGTTVTVFVQAGLVIEPLIVHRGVNVPPATYRHTAVEARFVVPFPQSIWYAVALVALQVTETSRGAAPETGVAVILSQLDTSGVTEVHATLQCPACPLSAPSSHTSPLETILSPQKRGETNAHSL